METFELNGTAHSTILASFDRSDRCDETLRASNRTLLNGEEERRVPNGRRKIEKRETRSWRKARKKRVPFRSAVLRADTCARGWRGRSGLACACTKLRVGARVYTRGRAFYIRVPSRSGWSRACASPWQTCTCACAPPTYVCIRTHAWQRSRVCLCRDPNEGRQASKLGRAAAARAAILLESGWKTSPWSTRSNVTRLDVVVSSRWSVERTGCHASWGYYTSVSREDRRASAVSRWTHGPSQVVRAASGVLLTGERSFAACTCATGRQVRENRWGNVRGSQRAVTLSVFVRATLGPCRFSSSSSSAASLSLRLAVCFGVCRSFGVFLFAPLVVPACGCSRSRIQRRGRASASEHEAEREETRERSTRWGHSFCAGPFKFAACFAYRVFAGPTLPPSSTPLPKPAPPASHFPRDAHTDTPCRPLLPADVYLPLATRPSRFSATNPFGPLVEFRCFRLFFKRHSSYSIPFLKPSSLLVAPRPNSSSRGEGFTTLMRVWFVVTRLTSNRLLSIDFGSSILRIALQAFEISLRLLFSLHRNRRCLLISIQSSLGHRSTVVACVEIKLRNLIRVYSILLGSPMNHRVRFKDTY